MTSAPTKNNSIKDNPIISSSSSPTQQTPEGDPSKLNPTDSFATKAASSVPPSLQAPSPVLDTPGSTATPHNRRLTSSHQELERQFRAIMATIDPHDVGSTCFDKNKRNIEALIQQGLNLSEVRISANSGGKITSFPVLHYTLMNQLVDYLKLFMPLLSKSSFNLQLDLTNAHTPADILIRNSALKIELAETFWKHCYTTNTNLLVSFKDETHLFPPLVVGYFIFAISKSDKFKKSFKKILNDCIQQDDPRLHEVFPVNSKKYTPLTYFIKTIDNVDIIQMLLAKGVDPTVPFHAHDIHTLPWVLALTEQKDKIINYLFSLPNVKQACMQKEKVNPWHWPLNKEIQGILNCHFSEPEILQCLNVQANINGILLRPLDAALLWDYNTIREHQNKPQKAFSNVNYIIDLFETLGEQTLTAVLDKQNNPPVLEMAVRYDCDFIFKYCPDRLFDRLFRMAIQYCRQKIIQYVTSKSSKLNPNKKAYLSNYADNIITYAIKYKSYDDAVHKQILSTLMDNLFDSPQRRLKTHVELHQKAEEFLSKHQNLKKELQKGQNLDEYLKTHSRANIELKENQPLKAFLEKNPRLDTILHVLADLQDEKSFRRIVGFFKKKTSDETILQTYAKLKNIDGKTPDALAVDTQFIQALKSLRGDTSETSEVPSDLINLNLDGEHFKDISTACENICHTENPSYNHLKNHLATFVQKGNRLLTIPEKDYQSLCLQSKEHINTWTHALNTLSASIIYALNNYNGKIPMGAGGHYEYHSPHMTEDDLRTRLMTSITLSCASAVKKESAFRFLQALHRAFTVFGNMNRNLSNRSQRFRAEIEVEGLEANILNKDYEKGAILSSEKAVAINFIVDIDTHGEVVPITGYPITEFTADPDPMVSTKPYKNKFVHVRTLSHEEMQSYEHNEGAQQTSASPSSAGGKSSKKSKARKKK